MIMPNTSSATKLAIAKLRGSDLPRFVPRIDSENIAKQVRECIFQSDSVKSIKISEDVRKELQKHLKQYTDPKFTISQYLLLLLCSVSTTTSLIEQHSAGLISDRQFIEGIKGDSKQNNSKVSRKVGGKKGRANASDRAGNAS